jgi:hypothetical protein
MRTILFGLLIIVVSCKSDYDNKLSERIEEIKGLTDFDNTVVVYSDSFRIRLYNRNVEHPFNPYHPYQYFRDTVKTEDLIKLLTSDHPYVRTYAFAALDQRGYDLFQIVLDNLKDTTRISSFTDDYGYDTTPPDMMLEYIAEKLKTKQKDTIAQLILTKYNHLNTINEILLFHKPIPSYYPIIRSIVQNGKTGKFGLVALSRYQKSDDIEFIKSGFKDIDYYSGYKVFFMAIEAYPSGIFKQELIEYKKEINKGYDMTGLDYYFNALAKYKDNKCTEIIKEFLEQKEYANEAYKDDNLAMIYKSLKKFYSPTYDPMIKQIEDNISDKEMLEWDDNHFKYDPWNY